MFRYKRKVPPLKKLAARQRVAISGYQVPGLQQSLFRMSPNRFAQPRVYAVQHINIKRQRLRLHRWIPAFFRLKYQLKRYGVDIPYHIVRRGIVVEPLQAMAQPVTPVAFPAAAICEQQQACTFPEISFDGFPVRVNETWPGIPFSLPQSELQLEAKLAAAGSQGGRFAPLDSPQIAQDENSKFKPLTPNAAIQNFDPPVLPKLRMIVSGDLEHFGARKTINIHPLDVDAMMIYSLSNGSQVEQKSAPNV